MAAMQGDVADVGLQLCGLAVLVSLAMSEQLESLVQLYGAVLQAMQQHSAQRCHRPTLRLLDACAVW